MTSLCSNRKNDPPSEHVSSGDAVALAWHDSVVVNTEEEPAVQREFIGAPIPSVDVDEARRFLDILGPGEQFTFQTFHDVGRGEAKDPSLTRVLHGTFDARADELTALHDRGAGIFVMVNRGDGVIHDGAKSCRTADNVVAVRANFVDLDGAPLEPVLTAAASPSIVVESSPGRWHAYWLVRDEPLEDFTSIQEELIARFGADPSVKDLPHVLRVPGFLHRKKKPFLICMLKPAYQGEAK